MLVLFNFNSQSEKSHQNLYMYVFKISGYSHK